MKSRTGSSLLSLSFLLMIASPSIAQTSDPVATALSPCLPASPVLQPETESAAVGASNAARADIIVRGPFHYGGSSNCAISGCTNAAAQRVTTGISWCDKYGYGSSQWATCLQWSFLSGWYSLSTQFNLTNTAVSAYGGCQNYNNLAKATYAEIAAEWSCLSGALGEVGTSTTTGIESAMSSGADGPAVKFILSTLQNSTAACSGSSSSSSGGYPPPVWTFGSSSSSSGSVGPVCPAWGCDGPPSMPIEHIGSSSSSSSGSPGSSGEICPAWGCGPAPIGIHTYTPEPARPIINEPLLDGTERFRDR